MGRLAHVMLVTVQSEHDNQNLHGEVTLAFPELQANRKNLTLFCSNVFPCLFDLWVSA